ncbi:MAG: CatB-related O-acetyltransferase [bacterium]|nr:CatB-related O-acetyltransferase [bacterium]
MHGPSSYEKHPLAGFPQVASARSPIEHRDRRVHHYDDPRTPRLGNVLYHFPFIGDKLVIGRFCAIARGVRFIMNGANHQMSGVSTYPFYIFGNGWEGAAPTPDQLPYKGDTVVGNDVWLGYETLVMPGVTIGNGAIVAARSVVVTDVPAYAVVGGNPARVIRRRFSDDDGRLEELAWWDGRWPHHPLPQITAGDVAALRRARPSGAG